MASLGVAPLLEPRQWSKDGVRVALAYSHAGVATTIYLRTSDSTVIIDCGDGALRDLIVNEYAGRGRNKNIDNELLSEGIEAIEAVLITHEHFDHIGGLFSLLHLFQMIGRKSPLRIIYPEGALPVEKLVSSFRESLHERCLYTIQMVPVKGGEEHPMKGGSIHTHKALHRDSRPGGFIGDEIPAVSYRISWGGTSVAYTGDTGPVDGLAEFLRGASLALIEATYEGPVQGGGGVHLTVDEAMDIGKGAKEYWLVHITGASYRRARALDGSLVQGTFTGSDPRADRP